jgi:hypothetical protein
MERTAMPTGARFTLALLLGVSLAIMSSCTFVRYRFVFVNNSCETVVVSAPDDSFADFALDGPHNNTKEIRVGSHEILFTWEPQATVQVEERDAGTYVFIDRL